jgi:hypothetical protein
LDEKVRRRWAACEAMAIGWGDITAVAKATGLSRPTFELGSLKYEEETSQMPRRSRVQSGNDCVGGAEGGDA